MILLWFHCVKILLLHLNGNPFVIINNSIDRWPPLLGASNYCHALSKCYPSAMNYTEPLKYLCPPHSPPKPR